jgi:hypothetical protein
MGPEEGGEHYQHFAEIVGVLRTRQLWSKFMHIGFQRILKVSRIVSLQSDVAGPDLAGPDLAGPDSQTTPPEPDP